MSLSPGLTDQSKGSFTSTKAELSSPDQAGKPSMDDTLFAQHLPLPYMIFDLVESPAGGQLELVWFNEAARTALRLPSRNNDDRINAEEILGPSSSGGPHKYLELLAAQDETEVDRIRTRQQDTTASDSPFRDAWAVEGQAIEFRPGRPDDANDTRKNWWAEVRVTSIDHGNRFSLLVLRPLAMPPSAPSHHAQYHRTPAFLESTARQDSTSTTTSNSLSQPPSERTPTLNATERGEQFGGLWNVHQEDSTSTASTIPQIATDATVNGSGSAPGPIQTQVASRTAGAINPLSPPRRTSASGLRLSHLPSPTLSAGATTTSSSRGSNRSLLSNGTQNSATSAGTSVATTSSAVPMLDVAEPPAQSSSGTGPASVIGMGISVSSAGIHLSQSVPISVPTEGSTQDGTISTGVAANPTTTGQRAQSPRPTALPPPAPRPKVFKPDSSQLLRFATIANLPRTGVIIADADLASGFVNPLARELLMGVPSRKYTASPKSKKFKKDKDASVADRKGDASKADAAEADVDNEPTNAADLDAAWWQAGWWSADDSWSSLSSGTSNGSFFPPTSSHSDRANPFDGKDLMHSAIIASGEGKRTAGSNKVRIGKPQESNRYRTTLAAILARSLVNEERREAAAKGQQRDAKGRWETAGEKAPFDASSEAGRATTAPSNAETASTASSATTPGESGPSFVGVGTKQGRKPYKVFDHSFSQRIIDPFEPLLDICARKGDYPTTVDEEDDPDAAASGMIVGIEVEVWDAGPGDGSSEGNAHNLLEPSSFVTSSSGTTRKKRVRRRLVEITAAPVFAPAINAQNGEDRGEHLGGVLLLRDVTDERRAMPIHGSSGSHALTRLREGGKRKKKMHGDAYFKQIVDNMPQMVWTTTPLGSHDFFNQNWYDFTGLEPEQSLGLGWQSPFHEDDMIAAVPAWQHSLSTGDPYSVEYRCRRADGAWRWQLGRALPLRSLTGEIEAWFGTCTDVEEFVQIRTQLAKTQEQFKAIIEGADVLIWAIDRDWICTFFSHPDSNLVGGMAPVGKSIKDIWPSSPLYELCQQVINGVAPRAQMEWVAIMESYYRCLLTPLTEKKADGTVEITGVIVVATDVTDLNLAQERLRKSYEDRAQLQASEAAANEASRLKSEFVANISHEIRTPIAGMIGMAELLLDETTLADAHRLSIQKIMRSGEILLEMVGMVLDMGKVEAGKLELEHRAFRLEDVVADARIFCIAAQKKGLGFQEDIDRVFEGQVLGDMPRLRQVLANVLSNAIKFTKEGKIILRLRQEAETRRDIRVRFEVEDTGVGIKEDAIPHLFKPFHQADASTARQYGGTGLGLCIARNLMELMGGSIDLESKFGQGTKMTVILPLEKAPMTLVDMPAPTLPAGETLKREDTWILVTDDNELNREIITKTLTKMRFNVESASDGLEAIAALHRRAFDVVLMDGQMHTLDGYEATRRIRADPDPVISNVKIIALTASAIAGDREKCIECGMNDYLSKPVRSKVLEAMLLKHLAPPPPSPSRRGSGSATPGAETLALMGMDLSPVITVDESNAGNSRRRPSHPSYDVTTPPLRTPPALSPKLATIASAASKKSYI